MALFKACSFYISDTKSLRELSLAYKIECTASYLENTYLEDVYK